MIDLAHLLAGAVLAIAGWLTPRYVVGSRPRPGPALLVDAAPFLIGSLLLLCAAGRPIFAGLVILALGGGFALADWTMRATLREPVVFPEMSEVPQVFTHPHLYLPFAGPGLVFGGIAAATVAGLALLALEPAMWVPRPALALFGAATVGGLGWLAARQPLLGWLAGLLRRLRPSGEPFADAERLGPFAMLVVHCILARDERLERQTALAPPIEAPALMRRHNAPPGPVIVVQCESFFDARRASSLVPKDLLAGFDMCCDTAALCGRLEVPGWGANTMRTEFAVLTGIPEEALGYDRFNPYYALARVPIASQVWRFRQAGYRTFCLHPFDRRFFRRDLVMPALGFEKFFGRETLGGSRVPPYCTDPALAHQVLRVLDVEGPNCFIFVITIDNHGPWPEDVPLIHPGVARMFDPKAVPQGAQLLRYLDGLGRSDEMLRILVEGLQQRRSNAVLAFYGDHLPSLANAFGYFGFEAPYSDYVIWPGRDGGPQRLDLPAHRLGAVIADSLLGAAAPAPGADGVRDIGALAALAAARRGAGI